MKNNRRVLVALAATAIAFGAAGEVHASGYAVFTHGASALGQGNAVTAHASDPSTIFYNPALMGKLDGTQVQAGTTAIFSTREYEPAGAGNPSSKDLVSFPSTFYATHKVNEKVSVGLGIFNPFGLSTEWDENWDGRYIATKSKLTTFNINPNVSYKILPSLTVAAGIDVILLDATLEKKLPSAALAPLFPAGFDINQKFKGDGEGIGFNLAVAYDVCDHLSLGASYRSEVKVDVSGEGTFHNATLGGGVSALNSGGSADLTLPPQFTAAVAMKPTEKLVLEAGLRWEGWSKFNELAIRLDNGSSAVTPRDWSDSWGLNAGGRYQLNDTVALMAGYVYGDSPVPDATFDPTIPDAKTHVFCAGTDLDLRPFTLAASYGYQLYENRNKSNSIGAPFPTANGKYKTDAHLVAVSVGYKF